MNHVKGELSIKRIGSKHFIINDKGFTVTKVRFSKKAEANAKELVHRWNAFEKGGIVSKLVDACKLLMKTLLDAGYDPEISRVEELTKIVIAKATPE